MIAHFNQRWGTKNGNARLTPKDVREIRRSNLPSTVLGPRYGVSPTTIQKIRRGETWPASTLPN